MNREIKFRLWDKNKKEWHTGRDFLLDLDGEPLFNLGYGGLSKYDYNCRDQIICQYTGRKDKNNKEIYEGDILRCKKLGNPELVEWYNDEAGFFPEMCNNEYYDGQYDSKNMEIIGNIFENPELLK